MSKKCSPNFNEFVNTTVGTKGINKCKKKLHFVYLPVAYYKSAIAFEKPQRPIKK